MRREDDVSKSLLIAAIEAKRANAEHWRICASMKRIATARHAANDMRLWHGDERHICDKRCSPMNEEMCMRRGLIPPGPMIDSHVYVCNRGEVHYCVPHRCGAYPTCPISGMEQLRYSDIPEETQQKPSKAVMRRRDILQDEGLGHDMDAMGDDEYGGGGGGGARQPDDGGAMDEKPESEDISAHGKDTNMDEGYDHVGEDDEDDPMGLTGDGEGAYHDPMAAQLLMNKRELAAQHRQHSEDLGSHQDAPVSVAAPGSTYVGHDDDDLFSSSSSSSGRSSVRGAFKRMPPSRSRKRRRRKHHERAALDAPPAPQSTPTPAGYYKLSDGARRAIDFIPRPRDPFAEIPVAPVAGASGGGGDIPKEGSGLKKARTTDAPVRLHQRSFTNPVLVGLISSAVRRLLYNMEIRARVNRKRYAKYNDVMVAVYTTEYKRTLQSGRWPHSAVLMNTVLASIPPLHQYSELSWETTGGDKLVEQLRATWRVAEQTGWVRSYSRNLSVNVFVIGMLHMMSIGWTSSSGMAVIPRMPFIAVHLPRSEDLPEFDFEIVACSGEKIIKNMLAWIREANMEGNLLQALA